MNLKLNALVLNFDEAYSLLAINSGFDLGSSIEMFLNTNGKSPRLVNSLYLFLIFIIVSTNLSAQVDTVEFYYHVLETKEVITKKKQIETLYIVDGQKVSKTE